MPRRTKEKKYSCPPSKQGRFCQHKNLTDQCLKVFISKWSVHVNFTRWHWQLVVGKSHLFFLGADRIGGGGGWGGGGGDRKWVRMLVVPFSGQISDLVPFTVSQTLVDYQIPSWYLLGCFSLNKMPEISITRTILMIWIEPLEHIDKGVLIFGIF